MNGHTCLEYDVSDPNALALRNGIIKNASKSNPLKNGHHVQGHDQQILKRPVHNEEFQPTPLLIAVLTYISYAILILFGYMRDLMRFYGLEKSRSFKELGNEVGQPLRSFR